MIEMDYCRTVRDSLTGERAVDEQTFASLAILKERLEQLKNLGGGFADVDFSPDVKKLAGRKNTIAVC